MGVSGYRKCAKRQLEYSTNVNNNVCGTVCILDPDWMLWFGPLV